MAKHLSLIKSICSIETFRAFKFLIRPIGLFFVIAYFVSSISIVEANDFESLLNDLGNKSRSKIKIAVKKLGELGNSKALPALSALKNKRLAVTDKGNLVILNESEDQAADALTGEKLNIKTLTLRKPRINNTVRRYLATAIAKLKLSSEEPNVRLKAAQELLKRSSSSVLDIVEDSLKKEKNNDVKETLLLVLAKINIESKERIKRIESINTIKKFGSNNFYTILEGLLKKNNKGDFLEEDSEIRDRAAKAINSIKQRQVFVDQIANLFYGLSLGSILLLAALGLAITFGLMGVINMAHGEMLMIGAYATFLVQNLFVDYLPSYFDWYLIVAIPILKLDSIVDISI